MTSSPPIARPSSPLGRVEEKLDRLERRLAFLDQLPAVLEVGASTADDLSNTHQLHERVEKGLELIEKLTRPETLNKLQQLFELATALPDQLTTVMSTLDDVAGEASKRGVDMPSLVPDLANGSAAVIAALQRAGESVEQPGLFGLLGALRDPDVSRAVGYLITVARILGRDLQPQRSALSAKGTSK